MKNTEIPYKNLSTDYERLYELLKGGFAIVGFADNRVDRPCVLHYNGGRSIYARMDSIFDIFTADSIDDFRYKCNEHNFRFFDPEEPTTNLIQINEPFGYEYEATACCQSGPITNENYCPICGRKIIK